MKEKFVLLWEVVFKLMNVSKQAQVADTTLNATQRAASAAAGPTSLTKMDCCWGGKGA